MADDADTVRMLSSLLYLLFLAAVPVVLGGMVLAMWLYLMYTSRSPSDDDNGNNAARHAPFAADESATEMHEPVHYTPDYVIVRTADGVYYSNTGQPVLLATALARRHAPAALYTSGVAAAADTTAVATAHGDDVVAKDEDEVVVLADAALVYGQAYYTSDDTATATTATTTTNAAVVVVACDDTNAREA